MLFFSFPNGGGGARQEEKEEWEEKNRGVQRRERMRGFCKKTLYRGQGGAGRGRAGRGGRAAGKGREGGRLAAAAALYLVLFRGRGRVKKGETGGVGRVCVCKYAVRCV